MARREISLEDKQAWMRERYQPSRETSASSVPPDSFRQYHFTPAELGELWHLSADAVRRLFEREPGVLVLGGASAGKRRYTTLRIPEAVAERVHRGMLNR